MFTASPGMALRGLARRGLAWLGMARLCKANTQPSFRRGLQFGPARRGWAGPGRAWRGLARQTHSPLFGEGCSLAWQGAAGLGRAGLGKANTQRVGNSPLKFADK